MRFLTDAIELFSDIELHISACCPNQVELLIRKNRKKHGLPFKQWFSAGKMFYREHLLTLPQPEFYCRRKDIFDENYMRIGA